MATAAITWKPNPASRTAVAEALAAAIGFSEESLAANRSGRLDPQQRAILLEAISRPWVRGLPAVGIWLVLWSLYATLVLRLNLAEAIGGVLARLVQPQLLWTGVGMLTSGDRTPLLLSGAAVSLLLLLAFTAAQTPWRAVLDLLDRRVEAYHGRVRVVEESLEDRGMPGAARFYFELRDERRFPVSRAAAGALDDGGVYDVYFTPRAGVVVGIAPAVDPRSLPEPLSAHPITSLEALLHPPAAAKSWPQAHETGRPAHAA